MNTSRLGNLKNEIKILLAHRPAKYPHEGFIVKAYHTTVSVLKCRLDFFGSNAMKYTPIAPYVALVKEGFYYEAERKLIKQLEQKIKFNKHIKI